MSRPLLSSMRPPLLLALVILAPALLAGCVDDSRNALGGAATDVEANAPLPFAYPCGPGATVERVPGVCVTRLEDPAHQLSEPSLALHPEDPDVVAVGVHLVGPLGLTPDGSLVAGRIYLTEDGGATWRSSQLPLPAESSPGSFYSDPALAFDANGTLHASGLVIQPQVDGRFRVDVFATASRDLGRTWESSTLLTKDGRNDRNWNAIGPDGTVYVTSHVCCTTSKAHWSVDGGRTWEGLAQTPEGCYTGSPVALVDGEPWMACYHADDQEMRLFHLDREARTLEPRGTIPGMTCIAPRILQGPDGALTVTCYGGFVARSVDGGTHWTLHSVASLASVEDEWDSFQVYWSEVDARNVLHLQLATFHRPSPDAYLYGKPHRVAHFALDAATLTPLHEARLTPETPERDERGTLGALVPPLGDDWYGIRFGPDGRGAMVWMWAGGIDVAWFEPAPS